MSTFSGLSTALSSLIAQRQALEVSGQNIANANTVGYTRQRANLASVAANSAPSMFSAGLQVGNGTTVTGVARLGDIFLDARLRSETGSASFAATKADAYTRLESTVAEPGDTGVSNALQTFWADWEKVGNSPGIAATRDVLLEDATALTQRISAGAAAVGTQWSQTRTELTSAITDVNSTATMIADLNDNIRNALVTGGSANEMIDQRNVLVTGLSALVGASGVERPDGTMDVMVNGNALVRGNTAHAIAVNTDSATMGSDVTLTWAGTTAALGAQAGSIVGMVAALAPAQTTGNGGILAEAAASYDKLATTLMNQVNTQHASAVTTAGTPGGAVFSSSTVAAGPPPVYSALNLKVEITDSAQIAVGAAGHGSSDGSMGHTMAGLGSATDGPDAQWTAWVADLGVTSRSATQRAVITETTRTTAETLQMANASVDVDEESANMLTYQRAYEGAARVLTAIDEMLDTLINRTGVVGR